MSRAQPLLLLPGAFCDERLFAPQLATLGEDTAAVFVELPDVDRVEAMAEVVLRAAPARFAVAGLSLGGLVALEIVKRAPTRVGGLALLSTAAQPDPPPVRAMRAASIDKVRAGGLEAQVEAILPLLFSPIVPPPADVVACARDMAIAVGADRYVRQVEAVMTRPDPRPALRAITCPTLVVGGADDVITSPAQHESLAEAVPGARLALVEGAGHLLTIERPAPVSAHLRAWLNGLR